MTNMPGEFPRTPPSARRLFHDKTPTASDFRLTPTSGASLYPNIDHITANNDLSLECENLGFSKKLSSNVLNELHARAQSKIANNSQRSILSPRSSRYNSSHRTRFTKMDSISSHYAASRNQAHQNTTQRMEVEIEKENIPSYDPNSKRTNTSIMTNITKRRKTELGVKEVQPSISPSKRSNNLQGILLGSTSKPLTSKVSKPNLKPAFVPQSSSRSASSTQHPQSHSRTLTKSTSTMSLKKSTISNSKTISNNISKLTTAKKLPRSSTLENLTKPTASSLSKSTSIRNLRAIPSKESLTSSTSNTLPRSKSIHNSRFEQHRPTWR